MPSELLVVAQRARAEVKRLAQYALNALAPQLAVRLSILERLGLSKHPGIRFGLELRHEQGLAIATLGLPPLYQLYLKPFIPFPRPRDLLEVAEEVKRTRQKSSGPRTQVSRVPRPGQGDVRGQLTG